MGLKIGRRAGRGLKKEEGGKGLKNRKMSEMRLK